MTELTSMFLETKLWHDTMGNTYSSARLSLNGETVASFPMAYGDESMRFDQAMKWMEHYGVFPLSSDLMRPIYALWEAKVAVYRTHYVVSKKVASDWGFGWEDYEPTNLPVISREKLAEASNA